MLVHENSQVQGPDGIGKAAREAEELEGIMLISQQSSMEGYLIIHLNKAIGALYS